MHIIPGQDALSQYLAHFLSKAWPAATGGLRMQPANIYDYGPIRSFVLDRDLPFQVELFLVAPGFGFPHEHRHPHVDSFEMLVAGQVPLTVNGRLAVPAHIRLVHGQTVQVTRVHPGDWHGAKPTGEGGSFLSIQHWLGGFRPTSVGLDWEGPPTSAEHQGHWDDVGGGRT